MGNTQKQLDYILIEQRYRNWAKRITNHTLANMQTPMQHRAVILDLQIALKSNYFDNPTKSFSPYDLQKARLGPGKVKSKIENVQITNGETFWSDTHGKIINVLIKEYPTTKKDKQTPLSKTPVA